MTMNSLSGRSAVSLIALATAACAQPSLFAGQDATAADMLLITNVNVIPMTSDTVLEGQAVLIENGRIVRLGPEGSIPVPVGRQIIDGHDGYLIPGLADMHVHLGLKLPQDGPASRAEMERDLSLYLPYGVTMVRHMRGDGTALELREAIAAGELPGPRLIVATPSLNFSLPESFGLRVRSPEEARAVVQAQAEAGYDLVKVHQDLPDDAFAAVIETAHMVGLPVAGHAQNNMSDTLRYDSLEHAEEVSQLFAEGSDFSQSPELLVMMKESGVTVTPTLIVFETIHKYLADESLDALLASDDARFASAYWRDVMSPEKNFFRASMGPDYAANEPYFRSESERLQDLTFRLNEAGIPLMLGTDAVGLVAPGVSVHQELELLVQAGLSPFEALHTATVAPAEWLEESDSRGQIAVGMEADLVLLDGNPLADISATRKVSGVVTGGTWYSHDALKAMLPE
jgi:imidazolonepropionase-like amidohydrolase